MLTVQALQAYGANTAEGISRCMGNEAFYLRMVGMVAKDTHMAGLRAALDAGDVRKGFEEAHALKGVLANLSLTPVLGPVSEITERLRAGEPAGCDGLLREAEARMAELLALIA